MTTSGDPKSAQVSFAADKLGALNASAYKVYTVTKDGVEGGGDQLLHFNNAKSTLQAGPDPAQVDLGKLQAKDAKPVQITLKGYHLDKLKGIRLSKSTTDTTGAAVSDIDLTVDGTPAANAVTISLGAGDFKSKIPAKDYTANSLKLSISLLPNASVDPVPTSQTLVATGGVTATAPAKPPAPASGGKKANKANN